MDQTSTLNSSKIGKAQPETMIKVDHVSMVFNMASEKMNNLKEYVIALAKRELRFKEFRALNDISLEVNKGDVFGILGTNGSGKSTLLKIIAGVLDPSEGSCEIHGNIAPLIELGAGFDMELTARENIYLNGALLGYSKEFINENFNEIVSFAEIEEFLDMPMKNYSSGMVARIAFAIATVIVPDILIVDEVLSVGDFMFQQKCERRIDTLIKEHQVTVLIVSHNNDQIERLCNKAVWIEKGVMRMQGDAHEVCEVYRLLGGHIGAKESERRIYEMLKIEAKGSSEIVRSISADDRYGAVAKMLDCSTKRRKFGDSSVVIAPGDDARVCFIANSIAGLLEAPLLMTRKDSLPDIVQQNISLLQPSHAVVVGGDDYISEEQLDVIRSLVDGEIDLVDGDTLAKIAREAFRYGLSCKKWNSDIVLLTHPGCTADHISFEPFTYASKIPVLFNCEGKVDPETEDILISSGFSTILFVGGPEIFSSNYLSSFEKSGIRALRFCGDGAYDSNGKICEWIDRNSEYFTLKNLIISSLWMPEDAYSIGPYAASNSSLVLLEDPQDLDSVAHAFDFIEDNPQIETLTFIGGENKYSALDKELLAKALWKSKEKHCYN